MWMFCDNRVFNPSSETSTTNEMERKFGITLCIFSFGLTFKPDMTVNSRRRTTTEKKLKVRGYQLCNFVPSPAKNKNNERHWNQSEFQWNNVRCYDSCAEKKEPIICTRKQNQTLDGIICRDECMSATDFLYQYYFASKGEMVSID